METARNNKYDQRNESMHRKNRGNNSGGTYPMPNYVQYPPAYPTYYQPSYTMTVQYPYYPNYYPMDPTSYANAMQYPSYEQYYASVAQMGQQHGTTGTIFLSVQFELEAFTLNIAL